MLGHAPGKKTKHYILHSLHKEESNMFHPTHLQGDIKGFQLWRRALGCASSDVWALPHRLSSLESAHRSVLHQDWVLTPPLPVPLPLSSQGTQTNRWDCMFNLILASDSLKTQTDTHALEKSHLRNKDPLPSLKRNSRGNKRIYRVRRGWSRGVRNKENVCSRSHHSTLSVSTENHHWCEGVSQSRTLVVLTTKADKGRRDTGSKQPWSNHH